MARHIELVPPKGALMGAKARTCRAFHSAGWRRRKPSTVGPPRLCVTMVTVVLPFAEYVFSTSDLSLS